MIVSNILPELIYTREIPSKEWIIEHNLNFHPIVIVLDMNNYLIECDIQYPSINTIIIKFSDKSYTKVGKVILR